MDDFSKDEGMSKKSKATLTSDYFAVNAVEIGQVFQRAVNHALRMHKSLGNPIAAWKDGKVVIVPPEEIVIPPHESETES